MKKAVVLSQNVESPENDFYLGKNISKDFLHDN